jgi:hypothetical protein
MNPLILALLRAGLVDLDTAERLDRQLDPVRARAWAEQLLTERYAAGLSAQQSRLVDMLRANGYNPTGATVSAFWDEENRLLAQSVADGIGTVINERAAIAAVTGGIADPFDFVNQQMTTWLDGYYLNADVDDVGSVGQLNLTARTQFTSAFREWYEGDLGGRADGLPQLIRALEPVFGAERAERVAITETTRVFVEMSRAAEEANPDTVGFRVLTSADELVCEICGPLHRAVNAKGQRTFTHPDLGEVAGPPFHVRCRCDVTPVTDLTLAASTIDRYVWEDAE